LGKEAPRRFGIAFGVVLAVCLAGEILDVLFDMRVGNAVRWRNSVKDLVNTMFWPTVWAVVGAKLSRRSARKDAAAQVGSGAAAPGPVDFDPAGLSGQSK